MAIMYQVSQRLLRVIEHALKEWNENISMFSIESDEIIQRPIQANAVGR